MKENKHIKLSWRAAVTIVLLIAATFSGVALLWRSHTEAAPSVKPAIGAAVPSEFSFSGVIGWWQGATNKTSMALFHNAEDCFVSVEHKSGTVDIPTELQKEKTVLATGGYIVTLASIQKLTLTTNTDSQPYNLYQYSVTTPPGANKVEGGEELGYLQLSNGYIKAMGYCDTVNELPPTIPALQAIKFKAVD
jgi:hypothetical protein